MHKYSVLSFTVGCTFFLIACGNTGNTDIGADTAAERSEPAQHSHTFAEPGVPQVESADYLKPGAAVTFSHDYDGETDPGVSDSFVLNVKPAYASGVLNLNLSTSSGLDLLVGGEQSFEMSDTLIAVPVEIFAEDSGLYRLNVNATVDSGSMMPSMRGYTVTIRVGTEPEVSQKASQSLLDTPEGEAVISNRAQETIY